MSSAPAEHHAPRTASKHQIVYFDAVRALSAQMVLVGHALNIFVPTTFMALRGERWRPAPDVFYMQNLGVLLFFVLSGFLVSRSALTKMSSRTWGFPEYLLERVARIFVPFVPVVVLVFVLDRVVLGGRDTPFIRLDLDWFTALTNLTMLYNNPVMAELGRLTGLDLSTRPIGSAAPFWSVVIEFWIYILFGLVLLRLVRDRRIGPLGIVGLLASGAVVAQTWQRHEGLVPAWVIGMLYAVGVDHPWFTRPALHRVVGPLGLLATPLLLWRGDWDVYDNGVAVALGLGVLSTWIGFARRPDGAPVPVEGPVRSRLRTGVTYLSDSSYSLYLVHFSLLIYLQTVPALAARPVLTVVGAFVAANVVALVYWYLVERHYPTVRRAVRRSGLWPSTTVREPGSAPSVSPRP